MAVATDLLDAATLAPANLLPLWVGDTLKTKVTAFWQAITDDFDEQTPSDRPIGAWIAVIAALAPNILDFEQPASSGVGLNTQATFQAAINYIYRLCKFAFYYNAGGHISNGQAAAILTAYNAQFA